MEEDLWAEKTFMSNVDVKLLPSHWVHAFVNFDPLFWVGLIFGEFFCNVGTDVAKSFLQIENTCEIQKCDVWYIYILSFKPS